MLTYPLLVLLHEFIDLLLQLLLVLHLLADQLLLTLILMVLLSLDLLPRLVVEVLMFLLHLHQLLDLTNQVPAKSEIGTTYCWSISFCLI